MPKKVQAKSAFPKIDKKGDGEKVQDREFSALLSADRKMAEEKLDPRIIRTKEAIQTVFKRMVCEMPYEKITVKAITEAARINRNTFYLHYNCVDDVLAEIQAKHSGEYSAIVSGFDQLKDTDKLVRSFFEYMEAQDD